MKHAVYSLKTVMLMTAASVMPAQLHAQDNATSETDADATNEIIVTGRLIEESVQEAPIAVTVFDAATLDKRGIDDLNELARSTPGFSFENFNGPFNVPVIRGQSQNRISSPIQNVSTFYNGVYLQRNYMIDASLLNMGQIEVLRGPQSAALGRNAFAGAITYSAKTPGDEYHGRALASVGENGFERYELSLEGPIVPGILSVIGGVSTGNYGGAWRNNHALANIDDPLARTRGNLGGYDYTAWHAGVNFTPIDEISIRANYIRNERDFENTAQYSFGTASFDNRQNNNNCSPNAAFFAPLGAGWTNNTNMLFCGVIPVQPVLQAGETRKPGLVVDPRAGISSQAEVLSVQADIKPTDQITLSYIFGYTQGAFAGANSASRNSERGLTGIPFAGTNLIDTSGNGNIESTSHEFRATYAGDNGLTVYGGFFTSDTDDVTDFALLQVTAQTTGPLTAPRIFPPRTFNVVNYDVSSGFGFIQYENGSFKVSAEGRYTEETLTNINLAGAAPVTLGTATFDYFTPRVTASYFFTDDNSIYVSWGRGVKAGGFNVAAVLGAGQATFGTEDNDTYELGLRNAFLGGDLILNATIYHIVGNNLQVSQPNTAAFGAVVGNLGGSETTGFELEASYKLSDPVTVYANASYADAKYKDGVIDTSIAVARSCDGVVCAANGAIGGNRLERTPRVMLNAGVNFDKPLNDDVSVYANGHISYQDEQFANTVNTAIIEARTIVDASVGVRWKYVDFRLAADNLFDEKYVSNAFQLGLGSSPFFFQRMLVPNLGDRRRVMGSVIVSF